MATITVKDASGSDVVVARVVNTGSAADADSLPTALSTESKAQIGGVTETAPASDTASSGINGRLQRIAQRLTSLIAIIPASLGVKAAAASMSVVLANDDAIAGAVNETAPANDTASSGLNGRLQRIAQRLTSLIALLPSSLGIKPAAASLSVAPASDSQFVVAPAAMRAQVTVTRPANVTPYTAGDVVGGAITFPSIGLTASHFLLTSADLRIDIAAIPSGMTSFRLYLYNVTPPSAIADNAAFDLPSGDRTAYIGYIDMGNPIDLGSTLFAQSDGINKHCKLGAGETAIYGYLVTNGGFTPAANSEVYAPTLRAVAL